MATQETAGSVRTGPGGDGDEASSARPQVDPRILASAAAGDAPDATDDAGAADAPSLDAADPDADLLAAIPLARRVEALLFASADPLPMKRLKELTACPDGRLVREALDELIRGYTAGGRAFTVEEIASGFQLRTAPDVADVVARLGRRPTEERLSAAALETLAIVAYRQPVLRADVERIRGVACGEVLRALQERGLVRIAGRAELPGSPLLYGTSQRFLEAFGLRDLQDLPRDRDLLRPPGDGAVLRAGGSGEAGSAPPPAAG